MREMPTVAQFCTIRIRVTLQQDG